MPKSHLKRIASPKSWPIPRKETKYVMRPSPGPHKLREAMPLSLALRELIKVAKTTKEAKRIIKAKDVFVDKKKRVEEKYPVGLMDIIELPQLEQQFRILIDKKGRLKAFKADAKEAATKLSRIESKTKIKGGKIQLGLSDGRSIIVDKDNYKIEDVLQLALPEQKILNHMTLEKGTIVLMTEGSHAGMICLVEEVGKDKVTVKAGKNQKFEVKKSQTFAVGKEKPAIDSIKQLMIEN